MVNKQKIKRTMIDQRFSLNSFGVPYQSSSMKFFYKFLHLRQCLNPSFGPFNMGLGFISPILEYTVGIKLASIIHFFDKRSRSRAYSHPSQCWKNSKDRNKNNRFLLKITFRSCIKGKRNSNIWIFPLLEETPVSRKLVRKWKRILLKGQTLST